MFVEGRPLQSFWTPPKDLSVTVLPLAAWLAPSGCGSGGAPQVAGTGSTPNPPSTTPPASGPGGSTPGSPAAKSAKRGIAYDLASQADLAVLSPGVSWWYNWGASPNASVPSDYATRYAMDFYPMLWNGSFNAG